MVAAAVIGGAVIGGVSQSRSARNAAEAQSESAQAGIDSQEEQFAHVMALLRPYREAGARSLSSQEDLLGLNGPEAQAAAVQGLKSSPQYSSLITAGEEGILQNASATGGVRGGNTQGALAQFRPAVLSQLIGDQFNRLGQITQIGQASAAGTGAAAQNMGVNISNLLGEQGAARAGRSLAQGQAGVNIGDAISQAAILSAMKVF